MQFPANITQSHLLQAIEKIDREGIPPGGASKQYVVDYYGKHYPPKLIVSYANIFANGEMLDRDKFEGGSNTPCFKLLEENGFTIIPKPQFAMEQVKIYEIKSGSAENARLLFSPEGKYFYWNNAKFGTNEVGDFVFIVNRYGGWALFTKIGATGIQARHNSETKTSSLNHEFNTYTVQDPEGIYTSFIRFDILEKVDLPDDWNWSKQLGQSEVFDLRKNGIKGEIERTGKIDDLEKLFQDGDSYELLEACREFLLQPVVSTTLLPEIVAAIKSKEIQTEIHASEFRHQLAQDKLKELMDFNHPVGQQFYQSVLNTVDNISGFQNQLDSYENKSNEKRLLTLIGELIAYCDSNAANKKKYNKYPDSRVLAKAYVRMGDWVRNLLIFKINENNESAIGAMSIRNAIAYLKQPDKEVTMLAESHRQMAARYLLIKPYEKDKFVNQLLEFFRPYNITPANPLNLTRILMMILYRFPNVKALWFEEVEGLVVCDNTGWLENARSTKQSYDRIVLWWDKLPSGRQSVLRKLRERIKEKNHFYIFYTINQQAVYRARIVDFAQEGDYKNKSWNFSTAWHHPSFADYKDEKKDGRVSTAKIVFLADEVIKLRTPIPVREFEFYKHYQAPTQNNMQPYSEINAEIEPDKDPVIVEAEEAELLDTSNELSFKDELRPVLTAIQTKPFVLLAGISGTGKSRLVRKLAYRTCAFTELQGDSPGNFEMIQVRPNWHDSTELMGYVSRISGYPHYVATNFLRFLVKAWQHPEIPFFLCLDEMNLAPVEQYFAEYLSIIESRSRKGGQIVSDAFVSREKVESDEIFTGLLASLSIQESSPLWNQFAEKGITLPPNLVVMGTVNMDETTHSFSRKVLDRAMTFEMNEVNLSAGLEEVNKDWDYEEPYLPASVVIGNFTGGGQVHGKFPESDTVIAYLTAINRILEGSPFKIAYRVRDEFLIYCYQNSLITDKDPQKWLETCLDEMTCMKILPRIEGDDFKTSHILEGLRNFAGTKYPNTSRKVEEMILRLKSGYTSFWS